jgi:hypothetical protein
MHLTRLLDGPSYLFSELSNANTISQVIDGIKEVINDAVANLNGHLRRRLMAKTVGALGKGGQRMAEQKLAWNRGTIRKGMSELKSGIICVDNFSGRGRKPVEVHIPNLLKDIKAIAEPTSQADPTFRTTQIYTPLTAVSVRERLIEQWGYKDEQLPSVRAILTKLNQLNYHPQTVAKTKPIKRIERTDAIFNQVHKVNDEADHTEGVLRLSMDAKARVKIGPFSRGGKSRQGTVGVDHDFEPEEIMTPFGIFLPFYGKPFFYFTKSRVTPDFMVDVLESLWPELRQRFKAHTLVINMDNGPENNSHRTQFIKRIVDFAHTNFVTIRLAYYPPYHSKYNPIERVWGVLENHWNGEVLDSEKKVLGLAKTMTWNGKRPVVQLVEGDYPTGIKLNKREMAAYERQMERLPGLERWFIDIPPPPN